MSEMLRSEECKISQLSTSALTLPCAPTLIAISMPLRAQRMMEDVLLVSLEEAFAVPNLFHPRELESSMMRVPTDTAGPTKASKGTSSDDRSHRFASSLLVTARRKYL